MPRIALHFGFWLTYLLLNAYVEITLAGSTFRDYPWWHRAGLGLGVELLVLPVKIAVTYLVLYRLLPRLYNPTLLRSGILMLLLALVIAALANLLVLYGVIYPLLYQETVSFSQVSSGRVIWSLIDVSSVVGLAMGFKYFRLRLASVEREKQLVEEKLQSELRFLRAQTNPHFLFNVLNSIYALARKKDDRTEETVLRLSQLLRFMIYECNAPVIALEKECQMIQDYLGLEELRFQGKLQLQFIKDVDRGDYQLPPLLLLPLVENAFKHGVSESRKASTINIELKVENGHLLFKVENSLEEKETPKEETTGVGLRNLRRQLALLYPDQHRLAIEAGKDLFQVVLRINPLES